MSGGGVFSSGDNRDGQHTLPLCLEGPLSFWTQQRRPTRSPSQEDSIASSGGLLEWSAACQVDWGWFHSLVLDAEGGVWEAGPCRSSSCSPTIQGVPELPLITLVAAGESHSVAIDTEGDLWVWTSRDLQVRRLLSNNRSPIDLMPAGGDGFGFLDDLQVRHR
jgi:alpha-tubulin suppressor-like RCC1 family protein